MARGKYKEKAEAQKTAELIEDLRKQITKLTIENTSLKKHLDDAMHHHAYQMAEMHRYNVRRISPEIELEMEKLRTSNARLKRALREGLTS